jgi:hypothetical protein
LGNRCQIIVRTRDRLVVLIMTLIHPAQTNSG